VAKEGDRHSKAGEDPEIARTPEEVAAAEARNALRQFDRLREMIREAVGSSRPFRLRPSALMELNRIAIEKVHQRAGAYRIAPSQIGGSKHEPPPWEDVPRLVEDLCDYVNGHGDATAIHLAAYVMWRLNWVHPFYDGNGRTTRAASYLMLCVRLGYEIAGTKTIPAIIASRKQPYYDALDEADAHCSAGRVDVSAMERALEGALESQLTSVLEDAKSPRREIRRPVALPGVRLEAGPAPSPRRRDTLWGRQPRWVRFGAKAFAAAALLVTVAWQLLIHWDNPRVQQVWGWIASPVEEEPKPAAESADPSGDAPKATAGSEAQP